MIPVPLLYTIQKSEADCFEDQEKLYDTVMNLVQVYVVCQVKAAIV